MIFEKYFLPFTICKTVRRFVIISEKIKYSDMKKIKLEPKSFTHNLGMGGSVVDNYEDFEMNEINL